MKIDLHWNLTRPVHDAWIHGTWYYKFNGLTYNRFPIDLWENLCDWLSGKSKSYLLDWTIGRAINYSNMNHSCPYHGYVFLKVDNMSVNNFPFEPETLIPSGRYRVDLDFTEGNRVPIGNAKLYFSVSDHRLEVV